MRLIELEAEFVRYEERFEGVPHIKPVGGEFGTPYHHTVLVIVDSLANAQGIHFLCPACYTKNGGRGGTHMVQVGFHGRGLKDSQSSHNREGKPSRWHVSGTGLADLTLDPSIDCGCWHGWVRRGIAL